MQQKTFYAIVKLSVEVADRINNEDVIDNISSECDCSFTYKDDICEILDTELMSIESSAPTTF